MESGYPVGILILVIATLALSMPAASASRTVQQNATNQTTTVSAMAYCPSCVPVGSYACYSTLYNTCTRPLPGGGCSGVSTFFCSTGKPNTTSTTLSSTTSISTSISTTVPTTIALSCPDGYKCGIPSDGCAVPGQVYNCPNQPATTATTTRTTASTVTTAILPPMGIKETCAWWNIFCWLGI